jgi:hypothetical protein
MQIIYLLIHASVLKRPVFKKIYIYFPYPKIKSYPRQTVPLRKRCIASDCPFKEDMFCVRLSI